ncbi:MAG: hypothetical protein AB7U05_09095 [Mangrovibacterium sp.]
MKKLIEIVRTESVAFFISALYQSIISGIAVYFNLKNMEALFFICLFIATISLIALIIIWVNKVIDFRNNEVQRLKTDMNDLAVALNTIFKYRMLRSYKQDHVFSQFNVPEIVMNELTIERNLVTNELLKNAMKEKSIIEIDNILDKLYNPRFTNSPSR